MIQTLRTNPRVRAAGWLALFLAVGALFSLSDISLVRAANASIAVLEIEAALPTTDPFAPAWGQAQPADVPLSAQQMYQPGGGGSVQAVQVRALRNARQIAFLVSWADATRDDAVKDAPSDAAAIQLPIDPHNLPYQCMGQSDSRVNIWQWKAAIEKVAESTGQPYHGTRNLTSNGICKAVETPGIPPTATSTWRDGRWYVIYARVLSPGDSGSAPLAVGENTNAAFAVWDGGKGETRGMKGVSTWIPVDMGTEERNGALGWALLAVTGAIAAGVVALAGRIIPH